MKPQPRIRIYGLGVVAMALFALANVASAHDPLPKAEVKRLTESAKTAVDYQKLATHYNVIADHHDEDAKEHEALAAKYSANPTGKEQKFPMSAETAAHCKTYAEHCRRLATEARAIATGYSQMAKQAGK